jgi:hypothetical protein
MTWPQGGLKHFDKTEFEHPNELDENILLLLDEIRERAGIPIKITSDYRSQEEHEQIYPDPNKRPNSPHPRRVAVDFKPIPFTATTRLRVIWAVTSLFVEGRCNRLGFEIADRHFHIDLDLKLKRPHFWLGRSK